MVVGLGWSNEPEGYDGGSAPTGRIFHAGQVNGNDVPDNRDTLNLQIGRLNIGFTTPSSKKP
jgi:hypothetical protein